MSARIVSRIKPVGGFAHLLYLGLMVLLPAAIFVLVRIRFVQLALVIILLSKWRMLAVKPRHWLASIRTNAIDIIVGVSLLIFMAHSGTQFWQLIWATLYGIWLLFIKPASGVLMVSAQAFIGQLLGLMALFIAWPSISLLGLVVAAWAICYVAARHFFTSFDENLAKLMAHCWGLFGASLCWVLGHWLLFYGFVAQPTLILSIIGFGLASLYYLEANDRLSILLRRQVVFIIIALVVIIVSFSDWGDKTI